MEELNKLKLCVEKTLSKDDMEIKEEFGQSSPGTSGSLSSLPGVDTSSFSSVPGSDSVISAVSGVESESSRAPRELTLYSRDFDYANLVYGIERGEKVVDDIGALNLASLSDNNAEALINKQANINYAINKYGDTGQEVIDIIEAQAPAVLTDYTSGISTSNISPPGRVIDGMATKINDGSSVIAVFFGVNVVSVFYDDPNLITYSVGNISPQAVPIAKSIPIGGDFTSSDDLHQDIYERELSERDLAEYKRQYSDVFQDLDSVWTPQNENRLKDLVGRGESIADIAVIFTVSEDDVRKKLDELGFAIIENFENNNSEKSFLYKRLSYFFENGILEKTNPTLNLIDTIKNRKFIVKKITISFSKPEDIEWTSLLELQGARDNDGKVLPLDPIEYQIRDLSFSDAIKKVIKERIEPLVNIKFEFIDECDSDLVDCGVVRVGFQKNKGCWSLIGLDQFFSKDEFTVNFSWIDAPTIMHEFCHVLGMIHEHQNPIGHSIQWNEEYVYKWAKQTYGWDKEKTFTNIIEKYSVEQLNGINYDPKSIMLYFFPPELTTNGVGSHQNLRFAEEDVRFLMSLLPGKDINYKRFYEKIYYGSENENEDEEGYTILWAIIWGIFVIALFLFI